ncbi:hypothetical protein Tco_1439809 [Tanacetum coccineum]
MARRFSSLLYYIPSLSKKGLVNGLPKMKYVRIKLCSSCEMRFKAKEVSFKDQKQFLFPKEAKFGFTWTCVSNACCKHKWEEKSIFWNGVVERQKTVLLLRLLGTLLSALRLPLSFWVEAVATACHTQNRFNHHITHGKNGHITIINDKKPLIKHLHIFGCICYITRDGENLDKMKEKGDPCVMVGYSTHSDLAPQRQEMSVENVSSGLVPQGQKASDYDNSDSEPPRQNVVPSAEKPDSSHQGLEFLFSHLLEEYYNLTHRIKLRKQQ